jgi:GH25 family lysozyme M1 (1,4-beta-N-acetylmuramidase)
MASLSAVALILGTDRALAARPVGIDVSDYQSSSINWSTLKNTYGISFGWAKISEGGSSAGGSHFTTYAANAKAAGVLIGPYHYARYDLNPGTSGATGEANYFWSVAKNYVKGGGFYIMPMLDVEASFSGQTKATISAWVNQWCLTVSNSAAAAGVLGVRPCIYCSSSHANSYLDSTVTQWPTDIADWPYAHSTALSQAQAAASPPAGISPWTPSSNWQFWQYDDQNAAQAYTTGDGDIFNGTMAQLISTMVIGGGDNATYVSSSVPAGVRTGQTFSVSITMNNSGSGAWTNTGANPYRLGTQNPQDNTLWGLSRVALPSSPINPGANATFNFTATAPKTGGVYTFSWKMVQDGVKWFGSTFTTLINVTIPGPGTNFGNYTLDTGNVNPTSESGYVALNVCGSAGWYSYGIPGTSNCTVFDRDIRWIPPQPNYTFTGRGYLTASAIVSSSNATATAHFFAVDSGGNDLNGPVTGAINECAYACGNGFINFYNGNVNFSSFGGWRSNTKDDSIPTGGCNAACGTFPVGYGQMHIQAAHWNYIDDWTCVGGYASSGVSDTANRTFSEANLYLYPAMDTSHGNTITTLMGLNGKTPGRVVTGDCNNANTLDFKTNAAAYGGGDNMDAYGFTWLFVPSSAGPQIVIGSDDGNRLWVNGVLKNDTNAVRGLTRDQDNTGAVSLSAGWNRLLFKLHNFTGGFQGTVSLRNGSNVSLNEPSVNYYDLGGYYSYGAGYEQDSWYPQITVNNVYGVSNPTNGQPFYGNNSTVTMNGFGAGQGPVPYWRTMQYQWGYGLGNADSNYADVSGTPTATNWSHVITGVTGHRRIHLFAVSKSGRTSFQSSGQNGGSVFQDSGGYARYYDVFVDNVAPLPPSYDSVVATDTNQITLNWSIPPDQGVNAPPDDSETYGAIGNQDSQNWYLVGDVGVQAFRNGSVISAWGTGGAVVDTGLTANTAYNYTLQARDNSTGIRGSWHNVTAQQGTTNGWTLSIPPVAGSIVSDQTNTVTGSNITWTAVGGFGTGKVQYYRYVWDQSPTYTFSDTEAQWLSGQIVTIANTGGTWYLHIKGYNGADVGNGTYDYPIAITALNQAPQILSIAEANGTVTLSWSSISGAVYRVQYVPDWSATSWTPLIPDITANGTNASTIDVIAGAVQRFYRVVQLP